jgi:hypothetical protein
MLCCKHGRQMLVVESWLQLLLILPEMNSSSVMRSEQISHSMDEGIERYSSSFLIALLFRLILAFLVVDLALRFISLYRRAFSFSCSCLVRLSGRSLYSCSNNSRLVHFPSDTPPRRSTASSNSDLLQVEYRKPAKAGGTIWTSCTAPTTVTEGEDIPNIDDTKGRDDTIELANLIAAGRA